MNISHRFCCVAFFSIAISRLAFAFETPLPIPGNVGDTAGHMIGYVPTAEGIWRSWATFAGDADGSIIPFLDRLKRADNLYGVEIAHDRLKRSEIERLAEVSELREVKLHSLFVRDDDLQPLQLMMKLHTIEINCPMVHGKVFSTGKFESLRTLRVLHSGGLSHGVLQKLSQDRPNLTIQQLSARKPMPQAFPVISKAEQTNIDRLSTLGLRTSFVANDQQGWRKCLTCFKWPSVISAADQQMLKQAPNINCVVIVDSEFGDADAKVLVSLESISVLRVASKRLTDKGVLELASLPLLQRVEVHCPEVTCEPFVGKGFPRLERLVIENFGQVTQEQVLLMAKQRPDTVLATPRHESFANEIFE